MRFKNGPQLPGAGRTRAGHHHGSHTPTSPGTILLGKMPITPNKSAGSVDTMTKGFYENRKWSSVNTEWCTFLYWAPR